MHCILLLFNFIPKTANLKSFFFLKSYVFFGVTFQLCPTSLPIFLARLTISLTRESLISHTFIHHVLVRSERTCIMRCINYYYSFFFFLVCGFSSSSILCLLGLVCQESRQPGSGALPSLGTLTWPMWSQLLFVCELVRFRHHEDIHRKEHTFGEMH